MLHESHQNESGALSSPNLAEEEETMITDGGLCIDLAQVGRSKVSRLECARTVAPCGWQPVEIVQLKK